MWYIFKLNKNLEKNYIFLLSIPLTVITNTNIINSKSLFNERQKIDIVSQNFLNEDFDRLCFKKKKYILTLYKIM